MRSFFKKLFTELLKKIFKLQTSPSQRMHTREIFWLKYQQIGNTKVHRLSWYLKTFFLYRTATVPFFLGTTVKQLRFPSPCLHMFCNVPTSVIGRTFRLRWPKICSGSWHHRVLYLTMVLRRWAMMREVRWRANLSIASCSGQIVTTHGTVFKE
jgi:hypothetical protein